MRKGWLDKMINILKLRMHGGRSIISEADKEKLRQAQEKAEKLTTLVYAQLGVELAVISGKDVRR
jgi:hypothetical protein